MSANGADEVRVRAAVDADEPAILGLLAAALGGGPTGRRTPEFFRWKHHHNPFGRSLALVAEVGDVLVGFRTLMRWRFRAGDRAVTAVRAVDTATRPDWQGRGVFSRLTAAAREQLRGDVDLIFNTPNARSLPGYRKLGWSEVGQVPIRLRPVRPVRLATGARAAARAEAGAPRTGLDWIPAGQVLADGDAVANLLAEAGSGDGRLATDHDVDTLAWRYADCPDLDYRALALRTGAGDLAGLAMGRLRARGPLTELTLAEVIVRSGDHSSARLLLRKAARADADHVTAHCPDGSSPAAVARGCGHLRVVARRGRAWLRLSDGARSGTHARGPSARRGGPRADRVVELAAVPGRPRSVLGGARSHDAGVEPTSVDSTPASQRRLTGSRRRA